MDLRKKAKANRKASGAKTNAAIMERHIKLSGRHSLGETAEEAEDKEFSRLLDLGDEYPHLQWIHHQLAKAGLGTAVNRQVEHLLRLAAEVCETGDTSELEEFLR